MNAHGKAEHIYCFGNVGLPVAAFLGVIDFVDDDIVLLLAVGSFLEGGKEDFSCVFGSSKEVNDVLLFLDDSFLLLLAVGYSLGTEYRIPKLIADLSVVLQRCRVLKLRFLGDSYEAFDGVPLPLEKGGIIRDGIICAVRCWYACDYGELSFFLYDCRAVGVGRRKENGCRGLLFSLCQHHWRHVASWHREYRVCVRHHRQERSGSNKPPSSDGEQSLSLPY